MPLVYLAGPITGLSYGEAVDWRADVINTLAEDGIVALSPMRWKTYLSEENKVASAYDRKEYPLSTPRGIMTRDRWDATRVDVVLVNVLGAKKVSIGTTMEIAWADLARKPIVLVMEPEGNPHDYPMIREAAGFIVDSLDKAVEIVRALLVA